MSENILSSLKYRELNMKFNPVNFVTVNYFNESMINRMHIEFKISHELETFDNHIQCSSWNSNGLLLCCGKSELGVQILKPFQNFQITTIPIERNHFLSETHFMSKQKNLLVVSTRNNQSFLFNSFNGLVTDNYVRIWDVEKDAFTKSYSFNGLVKKVATSTALPNQVWFNVDQRMQKIAEADIRTPSHNTMQLNSVQRTRTGFLDSRTFDVNPVDEITIAVGDKCQLLFYDRRMMSSSSINHPTKTIDTSSLNGDSSYVVQLKYNPSGNKLIITNSCGYNTNQYAAPSVDTSVENMRKFKFQDQTVRGAVTKNPSFLGEKYVLFDVFFKNYSAVFNLEDMRYIGKIDLFGQTNFFSNICSMPHPYYCLIASTNKSVINFVTPTSSN